MASLITNIILILAKTILRPVKIDNHPLSKLYQDYLQVLNSCYAQAYYWHGTGSYHYKLKGKSKYEGVDFSKTYDVLESIINDGGIRPSLDPIIAVDNKFVHSISLTHYRMYARFYAEFNQPKGSDFKYTYGSVKFWFYFLLPLQLTFGNFGQNLKRLWLYYQDKEFIQQSQPWMHTFTKTSDNFKWTALNFYKLRSDIPKNYGILIGIRKNGVKPISFDRVLERFETRTNNQIKLEEITHFEVPLKKVEETEIKLKKHGIKIPVIPLELGELYCNKFSLTYLSGIDD